MKSFHLNYEHLFNTETILCIYVVYVLILSILFSLYDDSKNLEKTSNQVCDLVLLILAIVS